MVQSSTIKPIQLITVLILLEYTVHYVLHVVFQKQQHVDSSLEGPHRKENILIIQTQYKSFSESQAHTCISNPIG
jgi:hypothetical protein